MKKLLREPLLHFLLLGAALFVIHSIVSKGDTAEPDQIVVTHGKIDNLAITFSRAWKRPPNEEELAGLVQDYIREEVYYRQALAMGLDRDDTIIRRRLRQKLEFVTDDIAALAEPTDAELTAYLKAHSDTFRVEGRLTFSHVYFNPDKHGARLVQDMAQLLSQLQQKGRDADLAALGDSFLLERRFKAVPTGEIAKQFGEKFATQLGELPAGQWHGPLESGYGVHLVLIEERTEGRVAELAEAREAVRREWANARRLESNEKYFQELLKRYVVTVENPESAETEKQVANAK